MAMFNQGGSRPSDLAKITNRLATLERKLSQFSEQRVVLKTTTGNTTDFVVIAKRQTKSDFNMAPPPFSMLRIRKIDQKFGVTIAPGWLLGGCFLREAPEGAIGSDRRAGKWGLVLCLSSSAAWLKMVLTLGIHRAHK